jgi:hypothetical protein
MRLITVVVIAFATQPIHGSKLSDRLSKPMIDTKIIDYMSSQSGRHLQDDGSVTPEPINEGGDDTGDAGDNSGDDGNATPDTPVDTSSVVEHQANEVACLTCLQDNVLLSLETVQNQFNLGIYPYNYWCWEGEGSAEKYFCCHDDQVTGEQASEKCKADTCT